jgi:AcrR family transcriptional regulator
MSQREAQRVETRARILRAAARVTARRGFAAVRTADVAKAARVSHGLVFAHFPSRDALLIESIAAFGREVTDAMHARVRQGAGVRDVLRAHLQCIEAHEDRYARLVAEAPVLPARARTVWIGVQSAISHHLAEAATRQFDAGQLRRVPLHLLFNTWIGLVHHYLAHRALFAPRGSVVARHGRTLVDHLMSLLSTK